LTLRELHREHPMVFWKRKKSYRVEMIGRGAIEYQEDGKVVTMGAEYLHDNDYDMVVYLCGVETWDPPHDHEPVTPQQREQIQKNITNEFGNMRLDWQ